VSHGVLTATQAIEYVLRDDNLDPFDALEFLDMWQHGEWDAIRADYPGAFEVLKEVRGVGL